MKPAFSPTVCPKTGKATRSQRSHVAASPTFTALLFQDSPDSMQSRSSAGTPATMLSPQLHAAKLSPAPVALFGDSPDSLGTKNSLATWAQTPPGMHSVSHAHSLLMVMSVEPVVQAAALSGFECL